MTIFSRYEHPLKEFAPIDVTDDGMVIWINEEHRKNVESGIDFSDDGTSN